MKRNAFLLFVSLLVLAGCSSSGPSHDHRQPGASPEDPLVRATESGYVRGMEAESDTWAWLGIPYAEPPMGELRWRAPEDPQPWDDLLPADAFCSGCTQYGGYFTYMDPAAYGELVGSEDCLCLNIWRPATAESDLPVFFWIHGGGNSIGEAGLGVYDGANLAHHSNVIVVTVHYRLGPFGWFNHFALKTGDPPGDSGNFGTLDLITALEWVSENIAPFGGDPDNVTLAGQSAGGYNVLSLMLSPLAHGLFHRAVVQSGPLKSTSTVGEGQQKAQEIFIKLLVADGYSTEEAQGFINTQPRQELAAYLRSKAPEDLYLHYTPAVSGGLSDLFPPFQDGTVIPSDGWESFISGNYNQVPLIVGATRDEVKLFLPFILSKRKDQGFHDLAMQFDPDQPMDLSQVCDILGMSLLWIPLYEPVSTLASGAMASMSVDRTASILSGHQGNIYAYRFEWDDEPAPFDFLTGASHSVDIPFVFGNFDRGQGSKWRYAWSEENRAGRQALSEAMMSYWAQFMYTGDPNGPDLPTWHAWSQSPGGTQRMVFDSSPPFYLDDLLIGHDVDPVPLGGDHGGAAREAAEGG
jgi:para-nitrobenzyl esterase